MVVSVKWPILCLVLSNELETCSKQFLFKKQMYFFNKCRLFLLVQFLKTFEGWHSECDRNKICCSKHSTFKNVFTSITNYFWTHKCFSPEIRILMVGWSTEYFTTSTNTSIKWLHLSSVSTLFVGRTETYAKSNPTSSQGSELRGTDFFLPRL